MADNFQIRGTNLPLQQRKTRRYNPDGGYVETSDWAGFNDAIMLNLFNLAARQGLEVEMSSSNGRHEVSIVSTRGDTRIDRWEFGVDDSQPGLLQNYWLDVDVNGGVVSEAHKFVIGVALKKGLTLTEALADPDVTAKYGTVSAVTARGQRIHEMMVNGQAQFQQGRLVLRHTTTVSNRYQRNVSDQNENCIYTHADFLSEVLSYNLWIFPLPGRLEYKATDFYSRNEPAFKEFYLWGWLKSVSPETAVANRCVEIQTTYKLDFWSTDVYAVANA